MTIMFRMTAVGVTFCSFLVPISVSHFLYKMRLMRAAAMAGQFNDRHTVARPHRLRYLPCQLSDRRVKRRRSGRARRLLFRKFPDFGVAMTSPRPGMLAQDGKALCQPSSHVGKPRPIQADASKVIVNAQLRTLTRYQGKLAADRHLCPEVSPLISARRAVSHL